jgi:deoxyadenosine/deoxycytidine kinase
MIQKQLQDYDVILLSGYPGSGKDTVGEALSQKYGYKRIAFADALKRICAEKFNVDLTLFHDVNMKDHVIFNPCRVASALGEELDAYRVVLKTMHSTWNRSRSLRASLQCMTKKAPKRASVTPRDLCIMVASYYRHVDDLYFVKQVQQTIDEAPRVVITDCRYKCEPKALKKQYASCVHVWINRASLVYDKRDHIGVAPETCDFIVENHETAKKRSFSIDGIVRQINNQ